MSNRLGVAAEKQLPCIVIETERIELVARAITLTRKDENVYIDTSAYSACERERYARD